MRLQIGEEGEQHLTDIDGFVRLRTLTGRDLQPGDSVQVTIGRHEDGRMYVVPPPLASSEAPLFPRRKVFAFHA